MRNLHQFYTCSVWMEERCSKQGWGVFKQAAQTLICNVNTILIKGVVWGNNRMGMIACLEVTAPPMLAIFQQWEIPDILSPIWMHVLREKMWSFFCLPTFPHVGDGCSNMWLSSVLRKSPVLFTGKLGAKKQVLYLLELQKQPGGISEQSAAFWKPTLQPVISSWEIGATHGCKAGNYPCSSVVVVWEHKKLCDLYLSLESFRETKTETGQCIKIITVSISSNCPRG